MESISVVIPSMVRSSLDRAVTSALVQNDVRVEVIVVVNNYDGVLPEFADPRVTVVDARERKGQNTARQLGIVRASHELIALLDDDDYWEPDKLRLQLAAVSAVGFDLSEDKWIGACGVRQMRSGGVTRLIPPEESDQVVINDVRAHLFTWEKMRRNQTMLQSSTLVFPRAIGLSVPVDALPQFHTDWGWLIACEEQLGTRVVYVPRWLSIYDSTGENVSKRDRTEQSVEWGLRHLKPYRSDLYGGFLATTVGPIAARNGNLSASVKVFVMAARAGASPTALSAGLLGAVRHVVYGKLRRPY